MNALDTDVVVRILIRDDPAQTARAEELLRSGASFLPKTVVLETFWVLESAYSVDPAEIRQGLTRFIGLPDVVVEDREEVATALRLSAEGLDFADALHHAASRASGAFRTFETRLTRRASRLGLQPPVRGV